MSRDTILAIPSMTPGGIDAHRSGHFGRCDAFTLVEVRNGAVADTRVVANVEHSEGGCMVPVVLLQRAGATSILVGGIGMRPLMGFHQAGIQVLVGPGETVKDAVAAYLGGTARPIRDDDVCGAHGHTHGHGHR